jgi:hypothetical protein
LPSQDSTLTVIEFGGDDDTAQAVSDQMYLVRTGLRQQPLNLRRQPVGELLYRGSKRAVGDRVDGQASGT